MPPTAGIQSGTSLPQPDDPLHQKDDSKPIGNHRQPSWSSATLFAAAGPIDPNNLQQLSAAPINELKAHSAYKKRR
ncbi:hypothetical protein PROFUN_04678 [Planoprotostelium fungivorum]|uniref:Uncharacterized protein n=1 Tax=Planoprotostelium fungivorum TaxID=1890364 RepID=A0A2P6NFW0_9EUKA|nr:hypothetical protein PROFUN_04678 [Planoprotostelium fungivorum]